MSLVGRARALSAKPMAPAVTSTGQQSKQPPSVPTGPATGPDTAPAESKLGETSKLGSAYDTVADWFRHRHRNDPRAYGGMTSKRFDRERGRYSSGHYGPAGGTHPYGQKRHLKHLDMTEDSREYGRVTRVYESLPILDGPSNTTGWDVVGNCYSLHWTYGSVTGPPAYTAGPRIYGGTPTASTNPKTEDPTTAPSNASPMSWAYRDMLTYCSIFRYMRLDAVEIEITDLGDRDYGSAKGIANNFAEIVQTNPYDTFVFPWAGEPGICSSPTLGTVNTLVDTELYAEQHRDKLAFPVFNSHGRGPKQHKMTVIPMQAVQMTDDTGPAAAIEYRPTPQVDCLDFKAGLVDLNSYLFWHFHRNALPNGASVWPNGYPFMTYRFRLKVTWHTMWPGNATSPGMVPDPVVEIKMAKEFLASIQAQQQALTLEQKSLVKLIKPDGTNVEEIDDDYVKDT